MRLTQAQIDLIEEAEAQKLDTEKMSPRWFSTPQKTQEAAEALHQPAPLAFDTAAVYRREPQGDYVMGLLQPIKAWPPHEEAQAMKERLGFVMVSCCEPIMGIWKEYQSK